MVLELRDKMKQFAVSGEAPAQPGTASPRNDREDALSALVNLGYKRPFAEEALKTVARTRTGLTVQGLIREALGVLMKR
jgi:Holliday junction DNA helicase RuvA